MGRRTAARVVPTAEPTASTCSNNSAVVFTPVVPVDHVADDVESGAASSARCREDCHEYVSHPRAGGAPHRSSPKSGTLLFLCSTVEVVVASSSHAIEQPAPAQPKEPAVASPDASPGTSCWMPCDSHLCLATQAACLQCPVGCVQRPRHQLPFNAQVWRSAACPHGDPSSELRSWRPTTAN
jgi:hypothetical protein